MNKPVFETLIGDKTELGNLLDDTLAGGAAAMVEENLAKAAEEREEERASLLGQEGGPFEEGARFSGSFERSGSSAEVAVSMAAKSGPDDDRVTILANGEIFRQDGDDNAQNWDLSAFTNEYRFVMDLKGGNDDVIGGGLADTIYGSAGNDTITGGKGADFIVGGDDFDTLDYSRAGSNGVFINASIYTFVAHDWNGYSGDLKSFTAIDNFGNIDSFDGTMERFIGSKAGDRFTARGSNLSYVFDGNTGNDDAEGGNNNDTLIGGSGSDVLVGNDGDDYLFANVSNDVEFSFDQLWGGSGEDTLIGSGEDALRGGAGTDHFFDGHVYYDEEPYGWTVNLNIGRGTRRDGSPEFDYLNNISRATTGNGADELIAADGRSSYLNGGAGADTLRGGSANDTLVGGSGHDHFYASSGNDKIDGIDGGVVDYSGYMGGKIEANLKENWVKKPASQDTVANILDLIGTNAGDAITGTDFGDKLEGRGGNDIIHGGRGTNELRGDDGDDSLVGGIDADRLHGGNHNDTLKGGGGLDTMWGGAGDDVYYVIHGSETVIEDSISGSGVDTIFTEASWDLKNSPNVERLTANSSAGLTLLGSDGANTITGGAGKDYIDGRGGIDHMIGGDGDDIYIIDDRKDVVVEESRSKNGNAGFDTAWVRVKNYDARKFFKDGIIGGERLVENFEVDGNFEDASINYIAKHPTVSGNKTFKEATDGGAVATVWAEDDGNGGHLNYVLQNSFGGLFQIVHHGSGAARYGEIWTTRKVDFETLQAGNDIIVEGNRKYYVLRVHAEENDTAEGGLVSTNVTEFRIEILNINDAPNAPIQIINGTIAERATGDTGASVSGASDPDGDTVTYEFAAATPQAIRDKFSINGSTGAISVVQPLDFEADDGLIVRDQSGTYYLLNVVARDAGGLDSQPVRVRIDVTNVNEAPTKPQVTWGTIPEGTARNVGSAFGSSDPEGDQITYDFADDTPQAIRQMFGINPSSGTISVTQALDYEAQDGLIVREGSNTFYRFFVVAKDGRGGVSPSTEVRIAVTNVNEAPNPPTQIINGTIAENVTGTTGASVSGARDPEGDSFTYDFAAGTPQAILDKFSINGSTGAISVVQPLDFEAADGQIIRDQSGTYYLLNVVARDAGGLDSQPVRVRIDVTNVNEAPNAPTFADGSLTFSTPEDANFTAALAATDPDGQTTLTFSFDTSEAGGGNANGMFAWDSQGRLTLAPGQSLDFEGTRSYTVYVRAHDGALYSTTRALTVNVTNVNEAPSAPVWEDGTQSGALEIAVAENTDDFSALVRATDPDGPTTFTYRFDPAHLNPDANGLFVINQSTGRISLNPNRAGPIDYESSGGRYTIYVQAVDGEGKPSVTRALVINVTDVNEAPNAPSVLTFRVDENEEGEPVGRLLDSIDPEGDDVTYHFASDVPQAIRDLFDIDAGTGAITVKATGGLDFESKDGLIKYEGDAAYYAFDVVARAGGLESARQQVKIVFDDVNEAPTDINFVNPQQIVAGATGSNADVVFASAVDPDVQTPGNRNNKYAFLVNGELKLFSGKFSIHEGTGRIFTNSAITEADIGTVPLTVVAYDAVDGTLKFEKTFNVVILGEPNDPPVIDVDGPIDWTILDTQTEAPFQHLTFDDPDIETGGEITVGITFNGQHGDLTNLLGVAGENYLYDPVNAPGTYTVWGSLDFVNQAVQALRFAPHDQFAGSAQRTTAFTVQVFDAANGSAQLTVTVRDTPANQAPEVDVLDDRKSFTVEDDGATVNPLQGLRFDDDEGDRITLKVTFDSANGTLGNLGNPGGVTIGLPPPGSQGVVTYTFIGTKGGLEAFLPSVTFIPVAGSAANGAVTTTFTFQVSDQYHNAVTAEETVTVVTEAGNNAEPEIRLEGDHVFPIRAIGQSAPLFKNVVLEDDGDPLTVTITFEFGAGDISGIVAIPGVDILHNGQDGSLYKLQLRGTAEALNDYLDRVIFDPTNRDSGPDVTIPFTVTVKDGHHAEKALVPPIEVISTTTNFTPTIAVEGEDEFQVAAVHGRVNPFQDVVIRDDGDVLTIKISFPTIDGSLILPPRSGTGVTLVSSQDVSGAWVVTLEGMAANLTAYVQKISFDPTNRPVGDPDHTTHFDFEVKETNNPGFEWIQYNDIVHVTSVTSNVAPSVTVPANQADRTFTTAAIDGEAHPFGVITISDTEGDTVELTIQFNDQDGNLGGFNANLDVTTSTRMLDDSVTREWTFRGAIADLHAFLRGVTFDPSDRPSGPDAVTLFSIFVRDDLHLDSPANAPIRVVSTTTNEKPTFVIDGETAFTAAAVDGSARPFTAIVLDDTDIGDMLTVTISFAGAEGSFGDLSAVPWVVDDKLDPDTGIRTLTLRGTAPNLNSFLDQLSFNPNDRTTGPNVTTEFTVTVRDDFHVAQTLPVEFKVTSIVNGRPTLDLGSRTTYSATAIGGEVDPLAGLTLNDDGNELTFTIQFNGNLGTLTLGSVPGVRIDSDSTAGNGTRTIVLKGFAADLNDFLDQATFDPRDRTSGPDERTPFTFKLKDAFHDEQTFSNAVTVVSTIVPNRAPVVTVDQTETTVGDLHTVQPFAQVTVWDQDLNDIVNVVVTWTGAGGVFEPLDPAAFGVTVVAGENQLVIEGLSAAVTNFLQALVFAPDDQQSDPVGTRHPVTFSIAVTDSRGESGTGDIEYDVVTDNRPPENVRLSNTSISEGAGIGQDVGQLLADELNAGDRITDFDLLDSAGGLFSLREHVDASGNRTWHVIVNGRLDYETQASHQITVRAYDSKGGFTDKVILIGVTDDPANPENEPPQILVDGPTTWPIPDTDTVAPFLHLTFVDAEDLQSGSDVRVEIRLPDGLDTATFELPLAADHPNVVATWNGATLVLTGRQAEVTAYVKHIAFNPPNGVDAAVAFDVRLYDSAGSWTRQFVTVDPEVTGNPNDNAKPVIRVDGSIESVTTDYALASEHPKPFLNLTVLDGDDDPLTLRISFRAEDGRLGGLPATGVTRTDGEDGTVTFTFAAMSATALNALLDSLTFDAAERNGPSPDPITTRFTVSVDDGHHAFPTVNRDVTVVTTITGPTGIDDIHHVYAVDDFFDEDLNPVVGGYDKAIVHDVNGRFTLRDDDGIEVLEAADDITRGINVRGNAQTNLIVGSDAYGDTLDGGSGGMDTLRGGKGDDTYVLSRDGVVVEEVANAEGGNDTVKLEGAWTSHTLADFVENLDASGSTGTAVLTGNGLANVITGNAEANILNGGAGDDTLDGGGDGTSAGDVLTGGSGNDTYRIRRVNDAINEGAGDDADVAEIHVTEAYRLASNAQVEVLKAGVQGVHLVGNAYSAAIIGSDAADTLDGGTGVGIAHTLSGGQGNDTYYIVNVGDEIEGELVDLGGGVFDGKANGDDDVAYLYRGLYTTQEAFDAAVQYYLSRGIERVILAATEVPEAPGNAAPTVTGLSNGSFAAVMNEDKGLNDVVGRVNAADDGPLGDLIYEIAPNDFFTVDAATGDIKVKADGLFDYETGDRTYKVQVRVRETTEGGLVSAWREITINLDDVNEAATRVNFSGPANIFVTSTQGTSVVSLSAEDPDIANPNFRANVLRFVNGQEDGLVSEDGRFRINDATGKVELNRDMTVNDEGRHVLNVYAYDPVYGLVSPAFEFDVLIHQPGVAGAPTDLRLTTGGVAKVLDENATVIGQVTASDDGDPNALRYYVDPNEWFDIDWVTGELTLKDGKRLDFETLQGPITVTVYARDGQGDGLFSSPQVFTFTVRNVDEAPTDIEFLDNDDTVLTREVTVDENSQFVVATVTGTPYDENPIYWSLASDGNGGGMFDIDILTGQIILSAGTLDYETNGSYTLKVVATNSATNESTLQEVTIRLRDVNEGPTSVAVDEETEQAVRVGGQAGAAVVDFNAADPDDVDAHPTWHDNLYRFAEGYADENDATLSADGWFRINAQTGEVTLAKEMAAPANTVLTFKVEAYRAGAPAEVVTSQEYSVTVEGAEGPGPLPRLLDNQTVLEHAIDNAAVGRLLTLDATTGETFSYRLIEGHDADGRFRLDANNVVRVADGLRLDFEQGRELKIKVEVTSSLRGVFEQELTITLRNRNVEEVTGSDRHDRIVSGEFSDQLDGGAGDDTLVSGLGDDELTGGEGADTFVFNEITFDSYSDRDNVDIITDFGVGEDRIELLQLAFDALDLGQLTDEIFHAGSLETMNDTHRIIYDIATGDLYYDIDGSGEDFEALRVATFLEHPETGFRPELTANHFFVV